jgi:hypothetical protein
MADNPTPLPKPTTSAPKPEPKKKEEPKEEPIDRAHVPWSEEFDRAKWTLPPLGIVGIALAVLAVVVVILGYANRAKPVAAGAINGANAVQLQDNTILAAIQLNVANVTEKPWFIRSVKATVKTDQGEFSDNAATGVDSERYFQAFPTLGQGASPILKFDQKIPAGQNQVGTIVVSFPMTKDQFDARKSLTVTIEPFDNRPVTLSK